jgi:hypothetical protein
VRDTAWKAQLRLHQRYQTLSRYRKKNVVIVSALARELVGFVWAIVCQLKAPEKLRVRPPVKPAARSRQPYLLNPNKKFRKQK